MFLAYFVTVAFLFQWNKDFLNLEGKVLVHDQEIQSYDSQG